MRILHLSVVTLLIASLATMAMAQTNELIPGFMPYGTDLRVPPLNTTKIDSSKVKFLLRTGCNEELSVPPGVSGIVSKEIDLSNDNLAIQFLQMGFTFWQDQCPSVKFKLYTQIDVYLRPGDPTAFTDVKEGFRFLRGTLNGYPLDLVHGALDNKKPDTIVGYQNFPRAFKNQQAYYAEEERQRKAALEKQSQAEQRTADSWAAFAKTHRVKQGVTIDQLNANPFVYRGQVVAISATFEKMNTETQGLFWSRGHRLVVSGISPTRFTRSGSQVVLAGRVLGNIEVKPGPMLVPHLMFVAIWSNK